MSIILRELLDLFPAHIRGKMCDELIHFHHALDKRHPIGIKFRFIGYQPSEKVRCEEKRFISRYSLTNTYAHDHEFPTIGDGDLWKSRLKTRRLLSGASSVQSNLAEHW
jgi:hypothetical protein